VVRTLEECWTAKLILELIKLMNITIGKRMTRKERNISTAAASGFFHLYLPVRINMDFFRRTNKVYDPSKAGIKDCKYRNRISPRKKIKSRSNTCRITLLEILLITT
jgi:hypothetical protein